jgi:hypothetical protein
MHPKYFELIRRACAQGLLNTNIGVAFLLLFKELVQALRFISAVEIVDGYFVSVLHKANLASTNNNYRSSKLGR